MTTSEGRLAAVPEAGGAPAARPAIETRGLTKRYPRVTALSDCSISVPAGRISTLVGPNGAGKTTLLRMPAGLARPTGGTAAVLGGAGARGRPDRSAPTSRSAATARSRPSRPSFSWRWRPG